MMEDILALDISAEFSDFSMELENPYMHSSFVLCNDDSYSENLDHKLVLTQRSPDEREESEATLAPVCCEETDGYGPDEGDPITVMIMGISFMARLIDAITGEDIYGAHVSETFGMNADVYFQNFRGGYFATIQEFALDNVRQCLPNLVLLEVGSNDLCWVEHDPIDLAQSLRELMGLIRCAHSVKAIVALQVLPRTKVQAGMRNGGFHDPLGEYNARVKAFNDEMERLSAPDNGILFWKFEYKVGGVEGMAICPRDGVHIREDRIIHYYHEIRGALLKARRVCWGQSSDTWPSIPGGFTRKDLEAEDEEAWSRDGQEGKESSGGAGQEAASSRRWRAQGSQYHRTLTCRMAHHSSSTNTQVYEWVLVAGGIVEPPPKGLFPDMARW